MNKIRQTGAIAAMAAILVACGGGGGGSSQQIAGIQGSGVAIGAVTGFGSIFVNGVEFKTSGATIRIDDQSGSESQLHIGDVVLVKGPINIDGVTGTANEVSFHAAVKGAITALNATALTVAVAGQQVQIAPSTLFDNTIVPADFTGLTIGLAVEVSGYRNSTGTIVATRIEHAATAGVQIVGMINTLDSNVRSFSVATQLIDYSQATVTGNLANGTTVIVKADAATAGSPIVARTVDVAADRSGAANDTGRVEGIVTRFASNADFDVNGQQISTDAGTQFTLNGLMLALDSKVEAEGTFNASGTLVATKVQLRVESSSRVYGTVDSTSPLHVFGANVAVGAGTQLEDKSSAQIRPFKLSELRVGDFAQVRGVEQTAGTLNATILERLNADNKVEMEGVARNASDPTFTVLGATITVTSSINLNGPGGSGSGGGSLSQSAFFQILGDGAIHTVRIRGSQSAGGVAIDRIDITS
jgi:Domain of unknown function (DUF5666)